MRFSHELAYDAAPATVLTMLGDPAFRERVCVAMHTARHDVAVDGSGPGMSVVVDQTQPARGIPSFAMKFVGEEIRIVQRESWQDAAAASLDLEIPGKPGTFHGTIALSEKGSGTLETVTGEVTVKLPIIGGRLEGLVADLLRQALRAEERVGHAWLAEGR